MALFVLEEHCTALRVTSGPCCSATRAVFTGKQDCDIRFVARLARANTFFALISAERVASIFQKSVRYVTQLAAIYDVTKNKCCQRKGRKIFPISPESWEHFSRDSSTGIKI